MKKILVLYNYNLFIRIIFQLNHHFFSEHFPFTIHSLFPIFVIITFIGLSVGFIYLI